MTKNEQRVIGACLRSLKDFSQVVVVDSLSTDRTVAISRELGAEVVDFDWNGAYPKKKQWILDNVQFRNSWVLYVDADERPTPMLVKEMAAVTRKSGPSAFDIPLSYVFMGRELRHGHQVIKRALLDRMKCKFPEVDDLMVANMWEVEGHYQPQVEGDVVRLAEKLRHDDEDPLYGYFSRHNRYSDWEAHIRLSPLAQSQIAKSRSFQGRLFSHAPLKPLAFFFYSYVVRRGWKDGRQGFDYAVALAFYYWQISVKTREARAAVSRQKAGG